MGGRLRNPLKKCLRGNGQKRVACIGKNKSYFYNCLSERGLVYTFINFHISAPQKICYPSLTFRFLSMRPDLDYTD